MPKSTILKNTLFDNQYVIDRKTALSNYDFNTMISETSHITSIPAHLLLTY